MPNINLSKRRISCKVIYYGPGLSGKTANLQILTGDPLKATTWVETVLLDGEVVYERDKDQRLQHLFGKDKNSTGTSPR